MSKKSLIDSIEINSPCSEDWNAMTGNEQMRFCSHCNLNVNNISALTRKQAMRFVRESKGRICVRYVKNPVDNKPIFAEKLYQITRRAGIAAGVLGASLSLSVLTYAQGKPVLIKRDSQTEISRQKDAEKDQSETAFGSISGTITDPNGAVIPNITVALFNEQTKQTRLVSSNDEGFYEFKAVTSGVYKLKFTGFVGFAPKEIEAVTIADGANVEQNVALDLGLVNVTMGLMVSVTPREGIHRAVADDDAEAVRELITRGANVNQKDENYADIIPLFVAVENGNAEIAEMLLNFGAKINARDDNRQTPLMRLDEDASAELVNLLIKHGAKANLVDNEGNTALIFAAHSVNPEVLQILIRHSANINAQNADGRTALMEAAEADNLENVRALLEAGAAVNLKDKEGETAYDLTTDEEIEKLLVEYGAIVEEDSN